jgi:tetratricopeptide (TPR) repeat protein
MIARLTVVLVFAAGVLAHGGAFPDDSLLARIHSAAQAYARGDASGVKDAETWNPGAVKALTARILDTPDTRQAEAAAMLMTELAASGASSNRASGYLSAAEAIVRGLPRPGGNRSFEEHWYAFAASLFLADTNPQGARPFVERGLRVSPRSAQLWILSGTAKEIAAYLGNPECTHPGCTSGQISGDRRSAEEAYRRALQFDPRSTEARLRLGHLLAFGRDHSEARRLLTAVIAENPPPTVTYLAYLFLAEIDTIDRALDAARHDYERAIDIEPGFQTPRIALSVVDLLAGDADRSRAAVQDWLAAPHSERPDPWWLYQNGERDDPALDWLRQEVRR